MDRAVRPYNANDAVTRCRQRVQQDTVVQHRGWKDDPPYGVRKLLVMGAERLDERGWERLEAAFDARAIPTTPSATAGWAGEGSRRVLTDDPIVAATRLDDASWCTAAESGPELHRLAKLLHRPAKLLRRWRAEILAHHATGASNGPVEA